MTPEKMDNSLSYGPSGIIAKQVHPKSYKLHDIPLHLKSGGSSADLESIAYKDVENNEMFFL